MSKQRARPILRHAALYSWYAVRSFGRFLRRTVPRVYAFGLMLVITWLTYMSIRYLIVSLAVPGQAPPQIAALPTRLDRDVIGAGRTAFAALDAAEHPRSPLAHYHRLDSWIEPDKFNDCTRSGCHSPLPHAKGKEVRAFLNMHATSIHCGVCHLQGDDVPRPLVWYDLSSGGTRDTPAIMQAYAMVTGPDVKARWKSATAEDQRQLVALLRRASKEAGGISALNDLADHFSAYRVGSAGFDKMLESAPEVLPKFFRGEYGAKLAIRDAADGQPLLSHPGTEAAVREWFARKDAAGPDERQKLLAAVHPLRSDAALSCTDCHRAEGSLMKFAALGYPPARVDDFVAPIVFRMIEHINAGRPFSLPTVIEPRD